MWFACSFTGKGVLLILSQALSVKNKVLQYSPIFQELSHKEVCLRCDLLHNSWCLFHSLQRPHRFKFSSPCATVLLDEKPEPAGCRLKEGQKWPVQWPKSELWFCTSDPLINYPSALSFVPRHEACIKACWQLRFTPRPHQCHSAVASSVSERCLLRHPLRLSLAKQGVATGVQCRLVLETQRSSHYKVQQTSRANPSQKDTNQTTYSKQQNYPMKGW